MIAEPDTAIKLRFHRIFFGGNKMKKIVSHQMPNIRIIRPLLAGGMLAGVAAGPTYAVDQETLDRTTSIETAISGDKGCVVGAREAQTGSNQSQEGRSRENENSGSSSGGDRAGPINPN